ncbi:MAG TPA: carbon-nitrogen hydrolase family protein [Ktedonobacteraceae bacterium]
MFIAAAQMQSSVQPEENLARAKVEIERAAARGAHMIVFPEIYMAWMSPAEFTAEAARSHAQSLHDPFVCGLGEAAREHGLWVISGMLETAEHDAQRTHNTTVVFDAQGTLRASYRKTHMFDAFGYKESDVFVPGRELFHPLETPFGRMGLFVCYELRFPEIARWQAVQGVDFFVVPSGWVYGPMKEAQWRHLVIARAIENSAYVIACDQVGHQFLGRSLIVDPMGVVLAEGSESEGTLFGEVDLQRVRSTRAKVPSLEHRKPEFYGN